MPVQIQINGGDAAEAIRELSALAANLNAAPAVQAQQPPAQPAYAEAPTQPIYSQQPQQPAYAQQPVVPTSQQPPLPPHQPDAITTAVPTAAQTYSLDQLAVAATPLMDAGRQVELVQLLQQFGAQSLTQLPKDRYGEFATALRGLGARI